MREKAAKMTRPPRFRRSAAPPAFRLTEGDVEIMRVLARHRFLRSTHIAALVGRSVDRTNDRLCRLFHAGHVDRPRAQLDYYPAAGAGPMVYALADDGARLLAEPDGTDLARADRRRNNRHAGRPFIEHQLAIVDFLVALEMAARERDDIRLMPQEEIVASFPEQTRTARNPLTLRVMISRDGATYTFGLVPDLAFGLMFADGSRRCFLVKIDRGTMPIVRGDLRLTSVERKLRGYLSAHASRQHRQQFGWKTFRVLTVTTDHRRMASMMMAAQRLRIPRSPGASLFFFATGEELKDPLAQIWTDGLGREARLA